MTDDGQAGPPAPALTLDLTREVCPMTFVRTRLALDQLGPGQTLLVQLAGAEPQASVPRTARLQGHRVIDAPIDAEGIMHLLIARKHPAA